MEASARDLSRRVSVWTLAALVGFSTIAYGLTVGDVKSIWIRPDELVYGSLARSFATTGHFALRGADTLAYPVGYPFLLAAAFIGRSPLAAYETAKWLNALLMSLAAFPVFLLARRVLPNSLSLLAAAITLLIPSLAYTGVLMSENAAFPLVLLALLAIVRVLECPSAWRQLIALVAIVPTVAVRPEGLLLVPILLSSIVLFAVSQARGRAGAYVQSIAHELRPFWLIGAALPLAIAALVLGEAVLGRSPTAFLGRYASSFNAYPIGATLRWSVYQLVDLEMYLAVIPFIPASIAVAALLRRAGIPRPQRALAALAAPAAVLFVLAAGATSSQSEGGEYGYPNLPPDLHDRYCFYVVPLYLILFLCWVYRRGEFSNRMLLPLLVVASALPLVLPYTTLHTNADFDALALLPWSNSLVAGRNVHYAMALTATVLCATLIPRRPWIAGLQIGTVALLLWFVGVLARGDMASASLEIPTSRLHDPSWIDAAVPPGAKVAVLWAPLERWSVDVNTKRQQALWRAEFFNSAIVRFFYIGTPMAYDLPEIRVRLRDGRLVLPPATLKTFGYLLVASPIRIDGRVVARDRDAGLTLYRLLDAVHAPRPLRPDSVPRGRAAA